MKVYILLIALSIALGFSISQGLYPSETTHTLAEFLEDDQTDAIPFDREAEFMCVQFSHVLAHNAQQEGFDAYTLIIDADGMNELGQKVRHALVGIHIDGGVVFVEPQSDQIKGYFYLSGTRSLESIERTVD